MPVTDDDLELWAAFTAKHTVHPPPGACALTEVVAEVRRLRAAARDAAAALARSPSALAGEVAGRLREALGEP